jgi:hypothetical protein
MVLERARTGLASDSSWPAEWRHNTLLGGNEEILYVTPEEAQELGQDIFRLLRRFDDRVDHPERRPAGAMPIETLHLAYPLLHLASSPASGEPQPATEQPEPPE